jgi:predicted aspartyl protease
MAATFGSVDDQGCPHARIFISSEGSPAAAKEFDAVIDTGFTAFAQMPMGTAASIGLQAVGEMPTTYANGIPLPVPVTWATVPLGSEIVEAFVFLEEDTREVLVGIHFLRLFRTTLIFSAAEGRVVLQPLGSGN